MSDQTESDAALDRQLLALAHAMADPSHPIKVESA